MLAVDAILSKDPTRISSLGLISSPRRGEKHDEGVIGTIFIVPFFLQVSLIDSLSSDTVAHS